MEGLDKFREAFADFSDNYVIIGGSACEMVMSGTVVRPRATHDIDMIVVTETMTPAFSEKLWNFIREAGYRPEQKKTEEGKPHKYELYRFLDGKEGYPEMIELLSRYPEALGGPRGLVTEPLPISDYIQSSDINYWIYGHSHFNIDVRIGNTFCVTNQLGYVFDNEHTSFRKDATLELN